MFICVLVTLLLLFGRIDAVAGAGILGTALGYLAGNGVAAKMGDPIVPIFKDEHPHHLHDDRSPVEGEE
jgi:proteasome assembly chaperone (PAC2) family protein